MATGITLNNWQDSANIVSSEDFNFSTEYSLIYEGKKNEDLILSESSKYEYDLIYNKSNNNLLFYGDNLDVMHYLIESMKLKNRINLIYIDPPYGTNSIFQSRNLKDSYKDNLIGSHYIEFLRRRIILLKELMTDQASIYIHLDNNMTSQIKIIMDEIFGSKNFRGLITRKKCSNKNSTQKSYGNISDYILFYSKSDDFIWHRATASWSDDKILKEYPYIDEISGRRYKKVPIHAPGIRNGETGKEWRGKLPPPGKHWQYTPEKLEEFDRNGDIYWSSNGNPRRKVYLDIDKGVPVQDIWLDVQDSLNQNIKITGYPTEKNPNLLKRIIEASSNEGDIVLDCFAGSGTTLGVSSKLNRKWIGIDNSSEAIENILKRFFVGLEGMGDYVKKADSNKSSDQEDLFDIPKIKNKDLVADFSMYSDSRFTYNIQDILSLYSE